MNKTVKIKRLEGIAILDSTSKIRDNFLNKWLLNGIDAIRFYLLAGRIARIPVLGLPLKKTLELYYRYLHTNSLVFPLKDIEEIINSATHLYVDPCPCRLVEGDNACDAPLFVCMRINNSAKIRKGQMHSKGLSREDAIDIMRNARKHGLVFSLESCVQPYQYNICSCCNDCCIAMRMRYDFKLDIFNSGPYIPEITTGTCNACGICVEKCPVQALSLTESGPAVNLKDCLGCGICSEVCKEGSIRMVISKARIRKDSEPGALRMIGSLIYVYASMIPLVTLYRLFAGSMRARAKEAEPNANDVFRKDMQ
jgi:Pyruvate/2-oxoacid:ferredoxin oxidoreductase delta subunit